MRLQHRLSLFAFAGATSVAGDFLGPTYPPPRDLTSESSLVRTAWQNASAIFDAYLKHGNSTTATKGIVGTNNVTFSAGLFSVHDTLATELQYHYTAPQVAKSKHGTHQVDANSVYRVASVSKLITVYAGMLGITEEDWNSPVIKFIPELSMNLTSPHAPDWKHITLWALASHLAGVSANGIVADAVVYPFGANATAETASGLPPLGFDALGPCLSVNCTIADFITSYRWLPPGFRPNTNPAYSNFGIMVLGLAISRITQKPYDELYNDLIFKPVGMTSSFVNAPTTGPIFMDRAVIPGPVSGPWALPKNVFTVPAGGHLSTITDLSKLGIAILNNTLLPADKTNKWMKPHSHSASLTYSMGAPWEIVRYVHPSTGKVTDIYGKLGDSGAYGGIVALVPDYAAGFTLLNAYYEPLTSAQTRGPAALKLINHIAEFIVPALEAQAAAEAQRNFVGTYNSTDSAINSSMVISFNNSGIPNTSPALNIKSWHSNGTDMLDPEGLLGGVKPRLLPTAYEEGQVTLQASTAPQYLTYGAAGLGPYTGFEGSNENMIIWETLRYGGKSLNTWRFGVDESGRAVSARNDAVGLMMQRN